MANWYDSLVTRSTAIVGYIAAKGSRLTIAEGDAWYTALFTKINELSGGNVTPGTGWGGFPPYVPNYPLEYPTGVVVRDDLNGSLYQALENTNTQPSTTPTSWVLKTSTEVLQPKSNNVSFNNSNLTTETVLGESVKCFVFNHLRGTQTYMLSVRDNNGLKVNVQDLPIDDNSCYIIIGDDITGNWSVTIL